jgi:hypothetical protein
MIPQLTVRFEVGRSTDLRSGWALAVPLTVRPTQFSTQCVDNFLIGKRHGKLTRDEAAKYRKIREEVEREKPEIIAKPQRARCEARRQQLAAIMQDLKSAREPQVLSLADIYERTGMDRCALPKLENVINEKPTIDTLQRYAKVVGKRLQIQVVD